MMISKACPRETYGKALLEAARTDERITALDADLSGSTMSCLLRQEFPERFFEMGIAEQNMVSVAAGMSLTGSIPFVHSFSMFITGRAFEQVRQSVALPKANVKLVGSSCGFSDFGDGATHQSLEDAAIMRAIPNMTVLIPMDPNDVRAAVAEALAIDGPVYIRLTRSEMEFIDVPADYSIREPFLLRDGSDVAIVANGSMTSLALAASQKLASEGIAASVINVSCLKPLAAEPLFSLIEGTAGIVTVEEHSVVGGLGSAILEALAARPKPLAMVGALDVFGQSAWSQDELLNHYGLTVDTICSRVRSLVEGRTIGHA